MPKRVVGNGSWPVRGRVPLLGAGVRPGEVSLGDTAVAGVVVVVPGVVVEVVPGVDVVVVDVEVVVGGLVVVVVVVVVVAFGRRAMSTPVRAWATATTIGADDAVAWVARPAEVGTW